MMREARYQQDFYPRSPRGERRSWTKKARSKTPNFYPRSPRGERQPLELVYKPTGQFLSTLPARGATGFHRGIQGLVIHFYPRSPRGERLPAMRKYCPSTRISIHAPREGSDGLGGDGLAPLLHFYPRSPRGERLERFRARDEDMKISIHAPREGSDKPACGSGSWTRTFLSTLPARGATTRRALKAMGIDISIHAPREGSDRLRTRTPPSLSYFYPRSPRGERLILSATMSELYIFLSTLPARGATSSDDPQAIEKLFLSTLPARGATKNRGEFLGHGHISIHAPREGSDERAARPGDRVTEISIHAPREGSDCGGRQVNGETENFYPRSPRGERHGRPP